MAVFILQTYNARISSQPGGPIPGHPGHPGASKGCPQNVLQRVLIFSSDHPSIREVTLRTVGFSYASRERNHCEQPFDFSSRMCEVRHNPRDVFDINSSHFTGNHYAAGSPKRISYVAERTRIQAPKQVY